MTKRVEFVLTLALFVSIAYPAIPVVWAQDSGGKNSVEQNAASKSAPENAAKEQSSGDKSKTEPSLADSQMNFPQVQGPVELRPAHGTRITLKMEDSSRTVYEAIGSQAKITVLFDPDYTPRNINVDLKGVSLDDALKIVAFESRTFWRPVTSDSIFVASDTPAKRREFEQQLIKTFYFPNLSSPTDLQDVVNGIRTLIEVPRIQQMPAHQTIMVRATPEQMAVTEKLVEDLNLAKQRTGGQYRLDFKITEGNDEKKTGARTYSLLIEPRETGKVRIGQKVPILTKDQERTYTDVGKSIDCQVRSETEHSVSLRLTIEFSEIPTDEHGTPQSQHGDVLIERMSMESSVTLELGTPTTVGSFQDPVSKHIFQIEATATRAKSKE